ncbi:MULTISPECIES: SDR family oxidoreductase [Fischerella]|nr:MULTISPECIES: SDR family oxidoreductase [Fischerella]
MFHSLGRGQLIAQATYIKESGCLLLTSAIAQGESSMPRRIRDSVIVITGASSGIGRATALEFAKQGATLLLAARREAALQDVAQQCKQLGGQALAVPTDVTDESAVQALARRAIENFGRLDVWVNNAAVSLFARFEDVPPEAFRRVIDTNLFGYVHGARAALPYFREQGSGILINVSSVVAITGQPYTSPYTISKYAIRGLSDSLRMELYLDNAPDIHVCTVLPASIDTPIFQHAANYTGRKTKALSPVYPAKDVAEAIVGLVNRPQREIIVGQAGYLLALEKTLAPDLEERMMARQVDQDHFQDKKPAAPTDGNLFQPMEDYTGISGNWLGTGGMTTQDVWDMARQVARVFGMQV